jgi:hypothetical protein
MKTTFINIFWEIFASWGSCREKILVARIRQAAYLYVTFTCAVCLSDTCKRSLQNFFSVFLLCFLILSLPGVG